MQGKEFLSVIMMVAIGIVSMSTTMARYDTDTDAAMEELALIMAAAAKQELTAKAMESTKCIEKVGWSQDLTLSKLKDMITIFKGKAWFKPKNVYIPSRTYLFAPQCPNLHTRGHVYVSGGGNHAEDNMAVLCGLSTEFYLTSAPCPDCAMMLYNVYKNKPKPTIHIARPYRGKGKTGIGNKNLNLECLAMLVDAGFTIIPWDWGDFAQTYITNDDCNAVINEMTGENKYDKRYDETRKVVNFVNNKMAGAKNFHEICSNALKKKKKVPIKAKKGKKVIKGKKKGK